MRDELRRHEGRVYSQGGEDGVIRRIFERIGVTNRYFVEFGAWDGRHWSNTANLRLHHGWSGLLLDRDGARRDPALVRPGWITPENVNREFARHGVPASFDLWSLDVDSHEYWIWRALAGYRPRVVVVEYNIFFGLDRARTIPYEPGYQWDKSAYHGASLAALAKLGRSRGYALVHTDSWVPNAFFVVDEALPSDWRDLPIEQVAAWRYEGEPDDPRARRWQSV